MVDEHGIPTICPNCGNEFMTLRWATPTQEWRVIHRDDCWTACTVTREQAHVLLEGAPISVDSPRDLA